MGLLKSIGKGISKVVKGAGKGLRAIAPIAGGAIGLVTGGPAGAAAGYAAGKTLKDKGIKIGSVAQAAGQAAGGSLANKALGTVAGRLPGKLGQAITPIARTLAPGTSPAAVSARGGGGAIGPVTGPTGPSGKPGIAGMARDALLGGKAITIRNVLGAVSGKDKAAGGVGGAIGDAVSYAKENPSTILAGAAGISGALDARKAGQLRDAALGRTRSTYESKAPLRERAMSGLMNTARPDLSSTYTDRGNPYAGAFRSSRPSYMPPIGPQDPGRVPMGGAGRVGGPGPEPGSPLSVAAAETGQRPPSTDPIVAAEMARGPATGGGIVRRAVIPPVDINMPLRSKPTAKDRRRSKVAVPA